MDQPNSSNTAPPNNGSALPAGFVPYVNPSSTSDALPPGFVPYSASESAAAPLQGGFSDAHGNGDLDTNNPNDNMLEHVGKGVAAVGAGVGKGLLDTLSGAAGLASKIDPSMTDFKANVDQGRQELDKDNQANPGLNSIGYGSETLAEFMLGDEALKGLSFADKLAAVSKVAKVLETSPRLVSALKIGARAAAVQGTQTAVRTDGSVADRAKAGLVTGAETGAVGSVLGGVGNLLEEGLSTASKAAKGVPALENIAATATSKPDVIQGLSQRIGESEDALHADYENGIQDLKKRLGGAEVDPTNNPMQAKAKELLAEPDPSEHPVVAQGIVSAGEGMDTKTRKFLEAVANGNDPAAEAVRDEEAAAKAKMGPKPERTPLDIEPESIPARPYTINDLIKMRQVIRSQANNYEPGDLNARALRSLLWDSTDKSSPVDDTIEQLAKQSNDATAVSDYRALRDNYRNHINDYQEPLIKSIRDGKLDDAAKAFVGIKRSGSALPTSGKVQYNTDVLRNILGPDGLHVFSKEVFGQMLSDSTVDGKLDPARFINTWDKVSNQTKGSTGLFDMDAANKGLQKLVDDARSAATLQRLTKAGVFSAAAGTGLHLGGLPALLGLTVAEGGGILSGRDLLNWIALHPNTWKVWSKASDVAPVVGKAGTVATGLAGQTIDNLNRPAGVDQRRVYQSSTSGLQ